MATVASGGLIHHRNTARIIKQGATPTGQRGEAANLDSVVPCWTVGTGQTQLLKMHP